MIISTDEEKHLTQSKTLSKKTRFMLGELEDSYSPMSKVTTKPKSSGQCGIGIETDRQINETELKTLEINLCVYDQLIFDKGAKTIQRMGKGRSFNTWCWMNPYLTPVTKINPQIDQRPKCKNKNYKTLIRKVGIFVTSDWAMDS